VPELRRLAGLVLTRFDGFFACLAETPLAPWREPLRRASGERLHPQRHGDLAGWAEVLAALPRIEPARIALNEPCVGAVPQQPLSPAAREDLRRRLDRFHPWRKGPFCLHGVEIDSEWRSDWKWDRLAGAVAPLDGRRVLDLGCGNGYYGFRALGAGAELVLGIDPTLRSVLQFLAVNSFIGERRLAVLPLADTDLPDTLTGFDTVLSMGVLYHRRDAGRHLALLRRLLRPGGQLLLETLILDEPGRRVLVPEGRYARMRNVYAIPTVATLADWLAEAGLRQVRVVGISVTSSDEQRATSWMRFQSLADFLDPSDPRRTVEGYPAPTRAMLLVER
jgi:tRNA (mo5U34)-methyltransferase